MIRVKVGKTRAFLPEPKTILLTQYIDWLEWVDENQPSWWNDISADDDDKPFIDKLNQKQKLQLFDFCAKELAFWSDLGHKEWRKAELSELFGTWAWFRSHFNYEYVEDWNCLDVDGKIYYLPQKFMSESTLEDYAESNAYEESLADALDGQYLALFGIAAIILRLKDKETGRLESYDDYDVDWRTAHFKDHLTAVQAHQIAFFLQRLSNTLQKDTQIYSMAQTLAQLKQDTRS